ncbi:hypothetical protein GCM10011379_50480 [Filimonas zeae]|uniref:Acyltransferase 3 domain-containing protein n=2 Tax=Filimonas zeae TaxID=1737353 RepID=A0A917N0E5_9BACT|nr:hypothetical protein GCM10011379_50480 [Filimonas zeae]
MVVFFHLSPFAETAILNNEFIRNSDLFVDFFFVLSGFVIAYTYQHRINSKTDISQFIKKRFFRVYPLHLIMLIAFLIVEAGKHYLVNYIHVNNLNNPNNNLITFLSSLFLLNSVKLPGVTDVSWNIPSWSISAEMISYLLFAIAVFAVSASGAFKKRNLVYSFLIVTAVAITAIATGSGLLTWSYDFGFLRGIAGFFTGVLCFNFFQARYDAVKDSSNIIFHVAEPACLIAIIASVCMANKLKEAGYLYDILFFIAVFVFAFEKGFVSAGLKKVNFLKSLGMYSYSVYMIHALFISLFNILFIRLLHFQPSAYSYLFILNFYIIYIAAGWTYRNIELRFKDLK